MEVIFKRPANTANYSVKINDLTVIYGPNNTGKTYTSYVIFSILKNMEKYFDIGLSYGQLRKAINELKTNGTAEIDVNKQIENLQKQIKKIDKKISSNLHKFFSENNDYFHDTNISLKFDDISSNNSTKIIYKFFEYSLIEFDNSLSDKKITLTLRKEYLNSNFLAKEVVIASLRAIINVIVYKTFLEKFIPIPFPLTSERTGISLFHSIFENNNSEIVKKLVTSENFQEIGNLKETVPTYALPIQEDTEIVRFYENYSKKRSFIVSEEKRYKFLLTNLSELVEGTYSSTNGTIFYHPFESKECKLDKIPLNAASSSVKALLLLDLFVRHVATHDQNQILVIDEPELNLHPEKQILMARLIAGLVNVGVKVLITTHSDYIVREINNLVMLNSADKRFKKNVLKEHGINVNEILDHNRISAYNTTKNYLLEEVEIDRYGINSVMFDNVFLDENKKRHDISEIMEN